MIDVRGLACPIPLLRARATLPGLATDEELVVLATDPEAPVDLGALAADAGWRCTVEREGSGWRITLRR